MPGEFPNCGCHYTKDDDGIHFCNMHKASPSLLAACKQFVAEMTDKCVALGWSSPEEYFAMCSKDEGYTLAVKAIAEADGRPHHRVYRVAAASLGVAALGVAAAALDGHWLLLAVHEYFRHWNPVQPSALIDDKGTTFKQAVEAYVVKAKGGA